MWPITDVDGGVEEESVGAELLVPPNTVGARVERVTHTGHRVNTVFAIFRLVRAFNLNIGDNPIISVLNVRFIELLEQISKFKILN